MNRTLARRNRRYITMGLIAALLCLVVVLLWPRHMPPQIRDSVQALAGKVEQWCGNVRALQKKVPTEARSSKMAELTIGMESDCQELDEICRTRAEQLCDELRTLSDKEFGTEKEVAQQDAAAAAVQQRLAHLQKLAQSRRSALAEKERQAESLLTAPDSPFSAEVTDCIEKGRALQTEWEKCRRSIPQKWKMKGGKPTQLSNNLRSLRGNLRVGLGYLSALEKAEKSDATLITETLQQQNRRADAALAAFPAAVDYVPARLNPELRPLTELRLGEAPLSIAAEGDLGSALVVPLVQGWLRGEGCTYEKRMVKNGVRFEIKLQERNLPSVIDVVEVSSGDVADAMVGNAAHMVFYGALLKNERINEKICSDALVFFKPQADSTPMAPAEIERTPTYVNEPDTPGGIAVDVFGLRHQNCETTECRPDELPTSSGKLYAGSYHQLAHSYQPSQLLAVKSPGNIAYVPSATNIATGQYWYTYDIACHLARQHADINARAFREYLASDAAARLMLAQHFVPMGMSELPPIGPLDNNSLPIDIVLKRLAAGGFETALQYGLADNVTILQGCQLPYPIIFPTGAADGHELDCDMAQVMLDRDIRRHLESLTAKYGRIAVVICGHADIRGGVNNERLSQSRADNFLKHILLPASGDLLRPLSKMYSVRDGAESPGLLYLNAHKNILVTTIGCATRYAVAHAPGYEMPKDEADAYYRRDRRAAIYVIVPCFGSSAGGTSEEPRLE